MGKFINYFGAGNTARGFTPFYSSIFQDTKELYVLKSGGNKYKTKILKKLSTQYANLYDVEIINSGIDRFEVEAIKVKDLDIAVVNGDLIHDNNIIIDNAKIYYIDLSESVNQDLILKNQVNLDDLKVKIFENLNKSYKKFEEALNLHGNIEECYYKYMDFAKADKLAIDLKDKLINTSNNKKALTYHRYLGAATVDGSIDFVMNITDGLKKYFIKGRSGTGKSTILKVIAKKAEENGFDTEIYHCGFDPKSIDMVIVRELGFAIFDSTAPHEYFPSSIEDEVIDVYLKLCTADVDKIYEPELKQLAADGAKIKKEAINYLKIAMEFKSQYDKIYEEAQDEKKANSIVSKSLFII